MRIFGISIDNLSREAILERVDFFLDEPRFHRIATVNPEFLLEAKKNASFREALLAADLRIADGFGIVLAGWLQGERVRRVPGADLMEEILKVANVKQLSIFLAVRADGLSTYEEIRSAILKKYPYLKISGADIDPQIHDSRFIPPARLAEAWAKRAGRAGIHDSIILCNFGAPEQEIFLSHLRDMSEAPRLAMGVGGSFDYLTGRQKRAPEWVRAIGLEWLWRLIRQPKRWKRIWNAVCVFPFRVIFDTIGK